MKRSTKHNRRVRAVARMLLAATAATFFAAGAVTASTTAGEPLLSAPAAPTVQELSNGRFTCTVQHLAVAGERQQRIARAATVEEARDLALTPVRAARRALQVAGLVAPQSEKISEARAKFDGFEARVEEEKTPSAVANEFGRLLNIDTGSGEYMQLADLNVGHANVRGPGGCSYSTGEIVAIVFGFILFVIPGIILLIVLC
jgi:hypothetical protein